MSGKSPKINLINIATGPVACYHDDELATQIVLPHRHALQCHHTYTRRHSRSSSSCMYRTWLILQSAHKTLYLFQGKLQPRSVIDSEGFSDPRKSAQNLFTTTDSHYCYGRPTWKKVITIVNFVVSNKGKQILTLTDAIIIINRKQRYLLTQPIPLILLVRISAISTVKSPLNLPFAREASLSTKEKRFQMEGRYLSPPPWLDTTYSWPK